MNRLRRKCRFCSNMFRAKNPNQWFCWACKEPEVTTDPRVKPKEGTRKCKMCTVRFIPMHHRHICCCDECKREYKRQRDRERLAQKASPHKFKDLDKQKLLAAHVACVGCEYGVESGRSDSGWECRGHYAMKCRPHTQRAFEAVQETGTGYEPGRA